MPTPDGTWNETVCWWFPSPNHGREYYTGQVLSMCVLHLCVIPSIPPLYVYLYIYICWYKTPGSVIEQPKMIVPIPIQYSSRTCMNACTTISTWLPSLLWRFCKSPPSSLDNLTRTSPVRRDWSGKHVTVRFVWKFTQLWISTAPPLYLDTIESKCDIFVTKQKNLNTYSNCWCQCNSVATPVGIRSSGAAKAETPSGRRSKWRARSVGRPGQFDAPS